MGLPPWGYDHSRLWMHGGETVLITPPVAVLRGFALNHNFHHRAHLRVYPRLNDVPVPALYGPSEDKQGIQAAMAMDGLTLAE